MILSLSQNDILLSCTEKGPPVDRYLYNAVYQGVEWLADEAQRRNLEEHVLQVARWTWVRVCAWETHVLVRVQVTKLRLQSLDNLQRA